MCDARPPIKSLFPSVCIHPLSPIQRLIQHQNWIPHVETKLHHFEAAAQYRMSMDEGEASRLGTSFLRWLG